MSAAHDSAMESVKYLRDVFPGDTVFNRLVDEGAYGDETHTISGDDLAGACWALKDIMDYLGVNDE
jgi:Na+-transporting NADH:ubiquinone oxidoreductase subunit NqrA